jgi:CBS domain-containing protein
MGIRHRNAGDMPFDHDPAPPLLPAADAARTVVTVSRSATLRQTAALLAANPAGAAIVQDAGTPIEVVSLRDVAAAIGAGADPDTSTVADLTLARRPYVAATSELVPAVARVIASGTDEALVLDQDGLVGLATLRTLCAAGRGSTPGREGPEPEMEIWVDRRPAATTVSVAGRLDERTARSLARVVNDVTHDCAGKDWAKVVRVDLARVDGQSVAGIAVLRQLLTGPSGLCGHLTGIDRIGSTPSYHGQPREGPTTR